jgi:hypothetical protein
MGEILSDLRDRRIFRVVVEVFVTWVLLRLLVEVVGLHPWLSVMRLLLPGLVLLFCSRRVDVQMMVVLAFASFVVVESLVTLICQLGVLVETELMMKMMLLMVVI